MQTIYIEEAIANHPRVKRIVARYQGKAALIYCNHYGEVFNRKSQNFRIQKQNPALIIAQKMGSRVLKTPPDFGIGGKQNYYFSHMQNCLYDCRYCFLQGMYQSAHYVWFINYEDFKQDITSIAKSSNDGPVYFFSGYDGDSLVFEPITLFLQEFLPFFKTLENAVLELRTKSTNIRELLRQPAFDHCIVAFSFTPDEISRAVEHKVPSVAKRISAMQQLAEKGWRLGLRFDPLIYSHQFEDHYRQLIDAIFAVIDKKSIHSVSVGPMRFPTKMYQKLIKLYPQDKLLAHPLVKRGGCFSYQEDLEQKMKLFVVDYLQRYLDKTLLFECASL